MLAGLIAARVADSIVARPDSWSARDLERRLAYDTATVTISSAREPRGFPLPLMEVGGDMNGEGADAGRVAAVGALAIGLVIGAGFGLAVERRWLTGPTPERGSLVEVDGRLDLGDPASALQTWLDAHRDGDADIAFLTLSQRAQVNLAMHVAHEQENAGAEHSISTPLWLDAWMLESRARGGLDDWSVGVIDKVTDTLSVATLVSESGGEVRVHLVTSPSDRWRIDLFIDAGGVLDHPLVGDES